MQSYVMFQEIWPLRNLSRVMHRRLTIAEEIPWYFGTRAHAETFRNFSACVRIPKDASRTVAQWKALPASLRFYQRRVSCPFGSRLAVFRWTWSSYKGFSVIRSDLKSHYRMGTLAHRRLPSSLVVAWRWQRPAIWNCGPAARNKNTSLPKTVFISGVGSLRGKEGKESSCSLYL